MLDTLVPLQIASEEYPELLDNDGVQQKDQLQGEQKQDVHAKHVAPV